MPDTGTVQRLGWFESVLSEPPQAVTRRAPPSRPSALVEDPEVDQLEAALTRLVAADNVAEERRSLMQSLEIVDRWVREVRAGGQAAPAQTLSGLAYRLVAWKRSD